MEDARALQAATHHRDASQSDSAGKVHRAQRNQLIHMLREEDPQRWTYEQLARAVGCSPELIALVMRTASNK